MVCNLHLPFCAFPELFGLIQQKLPSELYRLHTCGAQVWKLRAFRVRIVGAVAQIKVKESHAISPRTGGSAVASLRRRQPRRSCPAMALYSTSIGNRH